MEEETLEDKELQAELDGSELPNSEKKLLNRMLAGFKQIPAGVRQTYDHMDKAKSAMFMLKEMAAYSKLAQKLYWDNGSNKPKTNADYDKALKMVDKAIRMMDEVMATWPMQVGALMPMKEKMLAQRKDIELQKAGILVDPSELMPQKPPKEGQPHPDAPSSAGNAGETHA